MNEKTHTRLVQRLRAARYRYGVFTHNFASAINVFASLIGSLAVIASVVSLVSLVILAGYDHSASDLRIINRCIHTCQSIFVVEVLFNTVFKFKHLIHTTKVIKWITNIAILSTIIQYIYPQPEHPWIPALEQILYSHYYTNTVVGAYSVVEFSYAIMRLVSRRTNPSLLLTGSFLFFILIGSFVLMLPKCTVTPIDYFDSLFIATSAVCITGLTPVDVAATFTPTGLTVLAVLIQIGGIGVLTFTSFFALFFSGSTSIYNQLLIRDMVYSKTMNRLLPTLVYIIVFTLTLEVIGAVAVYFTIPDTLLPDNNDKMIFAAFHSLSSFCNAGFSNLPQGMANPALMTPGQSFYNVTSLLILAGAIGFPILVNLKDILFTRIKSVWKRLRGEFYEKPVHLYDLNTKLVLVTSFSILAVCSALFFFFEYDNTLKGMTLWQKVSQSVFNSLIPRSAGFASVDPAQFLPITLMIVMIQMWIGGASQSLAGGIKVNTFAAIFLNVRSVLTSSRSAWAYDRSISIGSTRRANTVLALALVSFTFFLGGVMIFDPALEMKSMVFEVTSALFTVGSSLGATSLLSDESKILLCIAMLLGRVGIISICSGFFVHHRDISEHLPKENIIIN